MTGDQTLLQKPLANVGHEIAFKFVLFAFIVLALQIVVNVFQTKKRRINCLQGI